MQSVELATTLCSLHYGESQLATQHNQLPQMETETDLMLWADKSFQDSGNGGIRHELGS